MRARSPALLVAVLGTALALATAAAADDGRLQIHLTPADQAAARAASLTMAELGAGWAGGLDKSNGAPTPLCPPKHARESDLVLTGVAVTSFSNSQAGFSIGSDVQLLRTSKMVRLDWQRTVVRPGVVACVRTQFAADARSSERIVSVRKLPFPRVTPYTAAYRIVFQAPGSSKQRGIEDIVLLARGRMEISLVLLAPLDGASVASAGELRIARALTARTHV